MTTGIASVAQSVDMVSSPSASSSDLQTTEVIEEEEDVFIDNLENIRDLRAFVDPDTALKLIKKGRATGNRAALWIRSASGKKFYALGKRIQRYAGFILVAGLVLFCGLCLGLQKITLETRLEKLWVEEGGRLEEEQLYVQKIHGSDTGASAQILLQTPDGTGSLLTPQALLFHLDVALLAVANEMKVNAFGIDWELKDICHKPDLSVFDERIPALTEIFENLSPCSIVSPLDCFWEGAKLLGPKDPVLLPSEGGSVPVTWASLDPRRLLDVLQYDSEVKASDTAALTDFMHKVGIMRGYLHKPCLNPHDSECPETAPNWKTKSPPNVAEVLSSGCYGFSTRYMHWHPEVLMGNISRNKAHQITDISAFQTVFHIMDGKSLYEHLSDKVQNEKKYSRNDGKKRLSGDDFENWSEESAGKVIEAWQKKLANQVARSLRNIPSKSTITLFMDKFLEPILMEFSKVSIARILIGYSAMTTYVVLVLKRWSDPVNSYGGIALAGCLLTAFSVAAGMGACNLLIGMNALSTQIVPFVALGTNMHSILQMAKTLAWLSSEDVDQKDLSAKCLARNGMTVLISSLAVSGSFFAAYFIPIPALRTFSLQMGIVTLFGCPSLLVLFPAVMALDQMRRSARRLDIFCCYGKPSEQAGSSYSRPAKLSHKRTKAAKTSLRPCSRDCVLVPGRLGPPGYSCTCPNRLRTAFIPSPDHRLMQAGIASPGSFRAVRASPMIDLAGSTSSIFRLEPPTCCAGLESACTNVRLVRGLTRFYLQAITNPCVKFLVCIMLLVVLGGSIWGIKRMEDGLDITEFVPKNTAEHRYFDVSTNSFGVYEVFAVTKGGFDYQHNQRELHDYHHAFGRLDHVLRDENGGLPVHWLGLFRDWLLEMDAAFKRDYDQGYFDVNGYDRHGNASDDGILGFKLRAQTGRGEPAYDSQQALNPGFRLVDSNGIINTRAFYSYLSAWTTNDPLGYTASRALLHPNPKHWLHDPKDTDYSIPKSERLDYAQYHMTFHGLRTTEEIKKVIGQVRNICASFEQHGLPNFPSGTMFSYWEQYVNLRFHLIVALVVLLGICFVVISVLQMNPCSAAVVVLMTAILLVELSGLCGWLHIKLNAISAVILVLSTGTGVEFSLAACTAFAGALGDKNRRAQCAMALTASPLIHGALASFIGIAVLAFGNFDFVFRYFFLVLGAATGLVLANSLVFLPVILMLLGPVADLVPNEDSDRLPVLTPEPSLEPSGQKRFSRRFHNSHRNNPAVSTVSLSTISEEDNISCQQMLLEPHVVVETTTSFPVSQSGPPAGLEQMSPERLSSFTATISTKAKVTIEVHRTSLNDSNTGAEESDNSRRSTC